MAAPKQLRHSMLLRERHVSTFSNHFNETPSPCVSRESAASVDVQHARLRFEKRTGFHRQAESDHGRAEIRAQSVTKSTDEPMADGSQLSGEDDWVGRSVDRRDKFLHDMQVCPVAVALRRAGYDVGDLPATDVCSVRTE